MRTGYAYDLSSLLDDEEQKREQEAAAEGPPAPSEPAPEAVAPPPVAPPPVAQPSAPEPSTPAYDDPFAGLAPLDYGQEPAVDLPPPPERQKPSDGPAALGLGLDILLNKGRQVPQMIAQFGKPEDVDYENWKRKLEWAKARAGRGGGANPYTLAIRAAELKARQRTIDLQAEGVGVRKAAEKVRENESARKLNNADPRTRATQDWVIAHSGYAPDSADAERIRQMDDQALGRVMTGMMQDAQTREGSPLASQDITHSAEKSGAESHATLPDRLEVAAVTAGRAVDADEIKRARAEQEKIADEQRKQNDEIVALNNLRAKLAARSKADPNARLPNQGNVLERGLIKGKAVLEGGSGMSAEDTSLDTDLTSLGLQSYMNKAHNAPNSAREQDVAATMYRGNGTAASALQRVDQRIREIEQKRSMDRNASTPTSTPSSAPTSLGTTPGAGPRVDQVVTPHAHKRKLGNEDDDLGVTYE